MQAETGRYYTISKRRSYYRVGVAELENAVLVVD
jgi:hypothetical protein